MTRSLVLLGVLALILFFGLAFFSARRAEAAATPVFIPAEPDGPFSVQVVGLVWLNPLQRRDYPIEWQLLWTLGLVRPNKDDDMVKKEPGLFSSIKPVASIAAGFKGTTSFKDYHDQYLDELTMLFHDKYFSDPKYFYNVNSKNDKGTWRELAGIRIEYALTERLDSVETAKMIKKLITIDFSIGNLHMPTLSSRSTPPDVRVTPGGPNAGFTSLTAAMNYLQKNPNETVWAMSWDAPSRPLDEQLNENLVLLVLAGPDYQTERKALAWLGAPATHPVADFKAAKDLPPRDVQAWGAVVENAVRNGKKTVEDIEYVIHDANNTHPQSSNRIGPLAHALTSEIPNFNFLKQTFNTPALLGEMGAATAMTNIALGIAYANHLGKQVLIAGTTDLGNPAAVLVSPPSEVRPINADKDWFRARSEAHAYLPWWGLRNDAPESSQGYSR